MSEIKQHNIVFNSHKIAKFNGYIYASIFTLSVVVMTIS